jgi:hypothetical protein
MADESERSTPLATITRTATPTCRNVFDTTTLALTDMEQANIAYGRNYIRLELDTEDFVTLIARERSETATRPVERAHIGGATPTARLARARVQRTSELLRTGAVVPRDPRDQPRPLARLEDDAPDPRSDNPRLRHIDDLVAVVKPTSLGLPTIVGWVVTPPEGVESQPPPVVPPALYLVQRYRLATYVRGFGLGDHLYSFTLFPDEEVEIEIKTWKSQEQVDKTGSSIFDGQSESAEATFEDAVQHETSQTSKRDESFEAHVEASGEASWGFGSASMQAGAKTATAESAEQFAKDVSSATQKVANKANRERKVEVTQSSEVKTTEGEETRTKRKIRNLNKCNTLNFNYFQLVRKYETRLELYDVKLRFSSGKPFFDEPSAAWHYEAEEVPFAQAPVLLKRVLKQTAAETAANGLFNMLGMGSTDDPGLDILTDGSVPDRMRLDVVPLKVQLAWEEAARTAANSSLPIPPRPIAKLPMVMSRDERVIATNAIYADAMLGKCAACDDFIQDSRVLEVEAQQLKNRKLEIEAERARLELAHFQTEPTPKRIIRFEGVPDSATLHIKLDERVGDGEVVLQCVVTQRYRTAGSRLHALQRRWLQPEVQGRGTSSGRVDTAEPA